MVGEGKDGEGRWERFESWRWDGQGWQLKVVKATVGGEKCSKKVLIFW